MPAVSDGLAALVVAMLAAGGCAGPLNEQVGLAGAPLPGLAAPTGATELDGRPSLAGSFDRSAWPRVAVALPQRQVASHPQFCGFFRWQRDRGPWDPAFPDAPGALVDPTDGGADLGDGATGLVVTGATIVAVPVAAAVAGPWIVPRSPSEPYQRVPPP